MSEITWDGLIAAEQVALEDLYEVRATGLPIDANIVVKEMSGGLLFHGLIAISRDGVVYLTARGLDVCESKPEDGWHEPDKIEVTIDTTAETIALLRIANAELVKENIELRKRLQDMQGEF
jgi:hypothetical protein